jgi:anti-sigma regulatory factor (Ser/Thr protein kinase)
MGTRTVTSPPSQPPSRVLRTTLPATLTAPSQARATIRHALTAWGLAHLAEDAQTLASELVANAAEHGNGQTIDLVIRRHTAEGRPGIACEITDTDPALPARPPTRPDAERGRGLAIVTALATTSGITATPTGKTAWFTLTTPDQEPAARHPEPELEPGA